MMIESTKLFIKLSDKVTDYLTAEFVGNTSKVVKSDQYNDWLASLRSLATHPSVYNAIFNTEVSDDDEIVNKILTSISKRKQFSSFINGELFDNKGTFCIYPGDTESVRNKFVGLVGDDMYKQALLYVILSALMKLNEYRV